MATLHELSTAQLRQALQLREQIEVLQRKLGALLGDERSTAAATAKTKKPVGRAAGKRTMSAEGRAKIAEAQKARWAKTKETSDAPVAKNGSAKAPKKKGAITPAGRAKLAAVMKARWAARQKGAPALNAPAA